MLEHALPWIVFNLFVLVMLVLDLTVFHRHAHEIRFREATYWSIFWIGLAAAFSLAVYFYYGHYFDPALLDAALRGAPDATHGLGTLTGKQAALKYLTGYVVELSLSVDNLFVFLLLFAYFLVPAQHQHRVLFWGILGAVAMRIVFIVLGVALINKLHWIMFIFGAFLVFTGVKMAFKGDEEIHPEKNPVLRLVKRWLPVTHEYHGGSFFIRDAAARLVATPLFVVLLIVETTDVVFAVDSVPAVIGVIRDPVTKHSDPFIAYTSNIMAILGLRAMYFALAGLMEKFHLLHYGLAAILSFVGLKMLIEAAQEYPSIASRLPFHLHISTGLSLSIIGGVLFVSVAASLLWPKQEKLQPPSA